MNHYLTTGAISSNLDGHRVNTQITESNIGSLVTKRHGSFVLLFNGYERVGPAALRRQYSHRK